VFISTTTYAQSPQKLSYQAVIRNNLDELVTDHVVGMRLSILQGSSTGTPVYVETQTPTSNANGLVTIEIGGGTPVTGTFVAIDWSTGTYFIKTETDPNGGTSYSITGTSKLLSVPYSLYAERASYSDVSQSQIDLLKASLTGEGFVKDLDNNIYNTVKIGSQVWMAENLKTTKYQNGDIIGTTIPATLDITSETSPKYQWAYNGDERNVATYGRLYSWYAATDSRNVCPTGWHLPTDPELTTLTDYLINNGYGYEGSGSDIGKSVSSQFGWAAYNIAGSVGNDLLSNNKSGFSGLPSGVKGTNGAFSVLGRYANWWSATEYSATTAWFRLLIHMQNEVIEGSGSKQSGLAVRCLRD